MITPKLNTKQKCAKISQKMDFVVTEKNADLPMASMIWKKPMIQKLISIAPESVNLFGFLANVLMAQDVNFLTLNVKGTKICYQFVKMPFAKSKEMGLSVDYSQLSAEVIYDRFLIFSFPIFVNLV